MEKPWEVVGWESTLSERGTAGCRLYLQQPVTAELGGEGVACGRVWFNPDQVKYAPVIGHKIIIITDDRSDRVTRIIVVG